MRKIRRLIAWSSGIAALVFVLAWLLPPWLLSPRVTTTASVVEPASSSRQREVTEDERVRALERARVWRAPVTPVFAAYLGNGPQAPRELDCTFRLTSPSGTTPKFNCVDAFGNELRIKYGLGGELPAEAAATRLLTALGFAADTITLVERLRCFGCPKEPFTVLKIVDATHADGLFGHLINEQSFETFEWVAVEQRFPATSIESTDGTEGWAFFELDKVSARKGGAPRAQVDALRLLAVFLAHWDNKSENQRLVCMTDRWPEGRACPSPFLMIQDLGATFGPRKVDLDDWERAPIWADRTTCAISMKSLPESGATFANVRISNAGRLFLAHLLNQLSDTQLLALFSGARFDNRRGPLDPQTPVADWVRVFKARRAAISDGPSCPAL